MLTITKTEIMKTMKYPIALFASLLLFTAGYGQQNKEDKQQEGYSEEVTIIAPYQPSISDARKIDLLPTAETQEVEKKSVSYNIQPQKIDVRFDPETLNAVRLQEDQHTSLKANFVKVGFGNYKTPYGELFSTTGQSEKHRAGFHLRHLSHSGSINNYATPKSSHNLAEVFGEKYFKNSSLYAKARYDRDVYHRYGFNPQAPQFNNIPYNEDDIKQTFSAAGANIRYEKLDSDKDEFDYHLDLDYYSWWDLYNSLEHSVALDVFGNKPVEWFDALEYQSFGMNGRFKFFNSGDSIEAVNNVHVSLRPFLQIRNGFYFLKGGVNLSTIMTDDNETLFSIFPDVSARIHVVPGYLTLFGGVTGEKSFNSLRSLTRENPFLGTEIINATNRRNFQTQKLNAYGGIKGNIMRGVDFRFKFAYSENDNYPLFQTNYSSAFENQFTITYDTLAITDFSAGIIIKGGERFKLDIGGHYYSYSSGQEHPWHLPEMKFTTNTEYALGANMPLTLSLSSTILTGRYASDDQGNAFELENIVDISAKAEYDYNESLRAFVRVNNLTAQNQLWWNNYPSYGLNFLIGAGYSF